MFPICGFQNVSHMWFRYVLYSFEYVVPNGSNMFHLLCLILDLFLAVLECLVEDGRGPFIIDREHLFEWLLFVKNDV